VEAFDLAVGLGPIRPGPLVDDVELRTGLAPQEAAVAAAVVGQHAFDGHPSCGEPGDGSSEHAGCGGGGLVVMDLGVGDPRVVVEDGVNKRCAHLLVVPRVLRLARGGLSVASSLLLAHKPPAAVIGDVAELLDVSVQHRARVVVLVATDRFPGGAVDVAEPVESTPDQHRVHRGRCEADLGGDLDRPEALFPTQVHDPPHHRCRGPVR